MLAPSLLDVVQDIADTNNVFFAISGFAESCLTASVGRLDPAPDWLKDVDDILARCRTVATNWLNDRPNIISPLVASFATYASLADAAASTLGVAKADGDTWQTAIKAMIEAAQANSDTAKTVRDLVAKNHAEFSAAHEELRVALQEATDAQEQEHQDITRIAGKLQSLFDRLEELGVGSSAAALSSGKAMVKTTAKVTYTVLVTETSEVPWLDVATTLYTTGNSLYDMIAGDAKIAQLLSEVASLMVALAKDVRALAVTHALLSLLNKMNEAYIGASQQIPRLNEYWDAEAGKMQVIVQALRNDLSPNLMLELKSLPTAATVWRQLATAAAAMTAPASADARVVPLKIAVAA